MNTLLAVGLIAIVAGLAILAGFVADFLRDKYNAWRRDQRDR